MYEYNKSQILKDKYNIKICKYFTYCSKKILTSYMLKGIIKEKACVLPMIAKC